MRFIARFISFVLLVAAVMAGVLDSIQSVASSQATFTPLVATVTSLDDNLIGQAEAWAASRAVDLWHPAVDWVLTQPTFAVCLVLALIFWMLAYKQQPAAGRFTA